MLVLGTSAGPRIAMETASPDHRDIDADNDGITDNVEGPNH